MQISIHLDEPSSTEADGKGPVTVGWLLVAPKTGVIFDAPTRVRSEPAGKVHAKSVARCPAVINLDNRYFQVTCPYDLSLGFERGASGSAELINKLGDQSPVRKNKLSQIIRVMPANEWRHPERPVLQVMLPYVFVADEPVFMSQVPPFNHYRDSSLPGLMIGGRFPIHVWPRSLMWAFEWWDISRPLTLKRGEPLFYVQFETRPQDRAVRVVEAERTDALNEYMDMISGAVNYVNQTFSLFEAAEARRPAKLVQPVKSND